MTFRFTCCVLAIFVITGCGSNDDGTQGPDEDIQTLGDGQVLTDGTIGPDGEIVGQEEVPAEACAKLNSNGQYIHENAFCDNGEFCIAKSTCKGGLCGGGENRLCESSDPCTPGQCDESLNECVFSKIEDGTPCNHACFTVAACTDGLCVPNADTVVTCPKPTKNCVQQLECDTKTGECSVEILKTAGAHCNTDDDVCTLEECDDQGTCDNTQEVEKCATENANNPCFTYICVKKAPFETRCTKAQFVEGVSCDDGNPCTTSDMCTTNEFNQKLCLGSAIPINDSNPCTDDKCVGGVVSHGPLDAVPCGGANLCDGVGMCKGGVCMDKPASACDDQIACTKDNCDMESGACSNILVEGYCTIEGSCYEAGTLSENSNCQQCNPLLDPEEWVQVKNGTSCLPAGNQCAGSAVCQDGICLVNQSTNCEDNNPCTTDTCDPENGCLNTPTDCKEPNEQVAQSCNPQSGQCENVDCAEGFCCVGVLAFKDGSVNPENPCQKCDSGANKLAWSTQLNSSSCDDGDLCTMTDVCVGGQCTGSGELPCNDNELCTTDDCHPTQGCVYPANELDCDDGEFCTTKDQCSNGQCSGKLSGAAVILCSDNNPCTSDTCIPGGKGCTHPPVMDGAPCDDGNNCTVGESCNGGTCQGGDPKDADKDGFVYHKCPGGTDCNDSDFDIKPGAEEICDSKDNNCVAGIDELCDKDNDDYCDNALDMPKGCPPNCSGDECDLSLCPTTCKEGGTDCNDQAKTINPGADDPLEFDVTSQIVGKSGLSHSDFDFMEHSDGSQHVAYWRGTNGGHLLYAVSVDGVDWVRTPIPTTAGTASRLALSIKSDGLPLIAHVAKDVGIRISERTASAWVVHDIVALPNASNFFDLEVEANGTIHLVYFDTLNKNLVHTYGVAPNWTTEVIDNGVNVGAHIRVTMGTGGDLHLAYNDAVATGLKYATNSGGAWSIETVYTTGICGLETSIALDSQGGVHIAHYELANSDALYSSNASGEWMTQTAASSGTVGLRTSITLDSNDVVQMTFGKEGSGVQFTSNENGIWATPISISKPSTMASAVLANTSPSNKVRLLVLDMSKTTLHVQTKTSTQPTTWTYSTVDHYVYTASGRLAGSFSVSALGILSFVIHDSHILSVAELDIDWKIKDVFQFTGGHPLSLDSERVDGVDHVCATRSTSLYYVSNISGEWTSTTVNVGTTVSNCRIKAGPNGPRITFYDNTKQLLRTAVQQEGIWVMDFPDTQQSGNPGLHDLLLESNGTPHIFYVSDGKLKHAALKADEWILETVIDACHTPRTILGSDGSIHVLSSCAGTGPGNVSLTHSSDSTGQWVHETIGQTPVGGLYDVVFDTVGNLYVAISKVSSASSSNSWLWTNASGEWAPKVLGSNTLKLKDGNQLHIDASGIVHTLKTKYNNGYYLRGETKNTVDSDCDGQ